jgi:rhamnosyltransferase
MVSILIPTYNAASWIGPLLTALGRQRLSNFEIIVVDSSSSDNTLSIAGSYGVRTRVIAKHEFDHGGTRTFMGTLAKGDVLVYLTQDAFPAQDTSLETLVSRMFTDERAGAAFGRQIPHKNANPFARHLREFNYPAQSHVRTFQDRERYGLKTAFCSNSFAAYRRKALENIGWFKTGLLMGEDMYACAKMLKLGYHIAYVAEAAVYHSHNYSLRQEFKRYFDMGAFLKKEQWILEEFGRLEGEGLRFTRSELRFILQNGLPHYVPMSLLRMAAKGAGFRLGQLYPHLPRSIIRRVSMHSK